MPFLPKFFKAKHPALDISCYFFGINHELQYQQLPEFSKKLLENCDVLFHEGRHGVVFINPFHTEHAFKKVGHSYYDWMVGLDEADLQTAQDLVNHFFHAVEMQDNHIPRIENIRNWVIDQLILEFGYFAKGGEVDFTVNNLFKSKNKKIVDLDDAFLDKKLQKKLDYDDKKDKGLIIFGDQPNLRLKKDLTKIRHFFSTGEYSFESDDVKEDFDKFDFIIEYANDFTYEKPEYIIERNEKWMEKIEDYIRENIDQSSKLALVCGIAHLPDMFARFISGGFEISELYELTTEPQIPEIISIPLTEQRKDMIFGYSVEREVYKSMRSSILGYAAGDGNWQQNLFKQQYNLYQSQLHPEKVNHDNSLAIVPYNKQLNPR